MGFSTRHEPRSFPYPTSSVSSCKRFLCFRGFFRRSVWGLLGGGEPTCSRARRLTSFEAEKGSLLGGFLGLIKSQPQGTSCFSNRETAERYARQCAMAEVCRNRTDRSTKGRPTGFEVPGGHQPTCTSILILNEPLEGVNVTAASCREDCGARRPLAKGLRRLPGAGPSGRKTER